MILKIYKKIKKIFIKMELNSLKREMAYCGKNVKLSPNIDIIMPKYLKIGNNTSIASFTTIYATFGVEIGDNCWISSNCGISSYNHTIDSNNRLNDKALDKIFSKPVKIGCNVWLGMNVVILPGVVIGDNAVIGAGSVVTKNIPDNELWFGNPAKFYKKINLKK